MALEVKYHANCYRNFKNCFRDLRTKQNKINTRDRLKEARVFYELIGEMKNEAANDEYVFTLNELFQLYMNHREALGLTSVQNWTNLKGNCWNILMVSS